MAWFLTWMTANLLGFSAGLPTGFSSVFAVPRTMAWLLTEVRPALQLLPTGFTAASIHKPARLIPKAFFPAHTRLLSEKRTFRTLLLITMTVMWYSWMSASLWSLTVESTRWWCSTTRRRRLKYSFSAMAANLIEYGFSTASTRASMAKLRASMIATLELAPAKTGTDMFGFKAFVNQARSSKGSQLSLCSLAFGRLPFA